MSAGPVCLVCDGGPGNMCRCSCSGGPVYIVREPLESLESWQLRNTKAGLERWDVQYTAEERARMAIPKNFPNDFGFTDQVHMGERTVPMILYCPICTERHIDEGDFARKLHHTHACQSCGHVWRPAIVNTHGVQFLPGFKN